MSSILKALQKLEQEKATRPDRGVDVAKGIVAGGRRHSRRPAWLVPAAMAGVAVLAVLITFTLMGGFAPRQPATTPTTAPPAAATPTQPTVPLTSAPVTAIGEQGIAATSVQPEVRSIPPHTLSTPATRQPAPSQPVAPLATAETERAEPARPATEIPQLPAISVSGIAWQKDGSARLAVVNGASVAEGSTVGGARVEEIFPDRLRFSYRGESFEVSLGKGTR